MTAKKAHKIAKHFYKLCRNPTHPSRHRNAINQTAAHYRIPERKVHTALFIANQPQEATA